MKPPATFPAAPVSPLDAAGRPRAGAFAGGFERVALGSLAGGGLRGQLRRLSGLKRWHHALIACDEVVLTMAVVDAGFLASGFLFIVERSGGKVLLDRSFLAPPMAVYVNDHPGPGARATLDLPGISLRLERRSDRYQLVADLGHAARLEAFLDTGGAPLPFALVTGGPGALHVTQKSGALPASGTLRVRDRRVSLDNASGALDYTQAFLPRHTRWRWASAVGRAEGGMPVSVNLAEGLHEGGTGEDVLFVGEGPVPLPRCTFHHDRDRPLAPWRVEGGDGALDLRFTPLGAHREERNLGLVRARFHQVAGTFEGRVEAPGGPLLLSGIPGVCEDQDLTW